MNSSESWKAPIAAWTCSSIAVVCATPRIEDIIETGLCSGVTSSASRSNHIQGTVITRQWGLTSSEAQKKILGAAAISGHGIEIEVRAMAQHVTMLGRARIDLAMTHRIVAAGRTDQERGSETETSAEADRQGALQTVELLSRHRQYLRTWKKIDGTEKFRKGIYPRKR